MLRPKKAFNSAYSSAYALNPPLKKGETGIPRFRRNRAAERRADARSAPTNYIMKAGATLAVAPLQYNWYTFPRGSMGTSSTGLFQQQRFSGDCAGAGIQMEEIDA